MTHTAQTIVPFLADIVERRGGDAYLGEPVTQAQHMLQAAAQAEQEGAPDELVAAALLHDIGHFVSEFGVDSFDHGVDNHHDAAGAAVLAPFFPALVGDCVRLHVAAKRYLCATDPTYFGRLSEASVHTLAVQGGPMPPAEVAAFEREPHFTQAVRVRLWDEAAKDPDAETPPFGHYAPLLQRIVDRHAALSSPPGPA
jgi:phosphonate degradation associated HDIG domain protein